VDSKWMSTRQTDLEGERECISQRLIARIKD
jgi:hypothetical protein